MYKGGNHIALTEQDKKLLEEYERITERNVISITIDEEKTSGITDSKFGGVPYWDMQKEYPKSDKGEMLMMLAQINLDELNRDGYNPDGKLPKTGMLQFFIDIYDNDGTYGLQDWEAKEDDTGKLLQNGHRVIYHKSIDYNVSPQEVESLGIPVCTNLDEDLYPPIEKESAIKFELKKGHCNSEDYACEKYLRQAADNIGITVDEDKLRLDCEASGVIHELEEYFEDCCGHMMFGSPYFTQYDPRSYKENLEKYNICLFQMDTDDDAEIMWGDSGVANFFIQEKDLAAEDFSDVLYNWDCC